MTDEEKLRDQQQRLKDQQQELMKRLRAIGNDLWGNVPDVTPPEAAPEGNQPAPRKEILNRPAVGIDNLWMTADETVDWTEALAHPLPTDGLTSPETWRFYHEQAENVLRGDVAAYTRVLRRINPLGDLTAYADGMTMRAPSAERVEGSFTCSTSLLEKHGKKYLAAMGLRVARDLMAVLPVSEAGVTAYQEGQLVLEATYPREALRHLAFGFLDPVRLTEECGGQLHWPTK